MNKPKSYQVFYTSGATQYKTSRVYKGIGSAKKDVDRISINQLINNIHIVGYDAMAHETFREIIR